MCTQSIALLGHCNPSLMCLGLQGDHFSRSLRTPLPPTAPTPSKVAPHSPMMRSQRASRPIMLSTINLGRRHRAIRCEVRGDAFGPGGTGGSAAIFVADTGPPATVPAPPTWTPGPVTCTGNVPLATAMVMALVCEVDGSGPLGAPAASPGAPTAPAAATLNSPGSTSSPTLARVMRPAQAACSSCSVHRKLDVDDPAPKSSSPWAGRSLQEESAGGEGTSNQ